MAEEEPKRTIEDVFREKRQIFSDEIQKGIKLLSSIKNISEVQVTFLSMRQRLLEENHSILEYYTKYKKEFREQRGREMVEASKVGQTRYQSTEKTVIIDANTSVLKERLEKLENQINFYAESIKTVDSVLFGVKDRINAQKLLDGN